MRDNGGDKVMKFANEKYMPDGETRRCPARGLTGQCKRKWDRHGHEDGPHNPPDACYFNGD